MRFNLETVEKDYDKIALLLNQYTENKSRYHKKEIIKLYKGERGGL